jgi:hypothetical protein
VPPAAATASVPEAVAPAAAATPVEVQPPATQPLDPPSPTQPVAAAVAPAQAQTPAQASSEAIDIWAAEGDPDEHPIGEIPAATFQEGLPPGDPLAGASEPSPGLPTQGQGLKPFARNWLQAIRQRLNPQGPQ